MRCGGWEINWTSLETGRGLPAPMIQRWTQQNSRRLVSSTCRTQRRFLIVLQSYSFELNLALSHIFTDISCCKSLLRNSFVLFFLLIPIVLWRMIAELKRDTTFLYKPKGGFTWVSEVRKGGRLGMWSGHRGEAWQDSDTEGSRKRLGNLMHLHGSLITSVPAGLQSLLWSLLGPQP